MSKAHQNDFYKTDKYIAMELVAIARNHQASSVILSSLVAMVIDSNNHYGAVLISSKDLAELCGYKSVRTVIRAVAVLVEFGFIGIGKVGRSNVYILNPDLVSFKSGNSSTGTQLDNIKVYVNDSDSVALKYTVKGLEGVRSKHIRSVKELNSRHVKVKGATKEKKVESIEVRIEKDTGKRYIYTEIGNKIYL
jgi:hypothetical protein